MSRNNLEVSVAFAMTLLNDTQCFMRGVRVMANQTGNSAPDRIAPTFANRAFLDPLINVIKHSRHTFF